MSKGREWGGGVLRGGVGCIELGCGSEKDVSVGGVRGCGNCFWWSLDEGVGWCVIWSSEGKGVVGFLVGVGRVCSGEASCGEELG